MDIYLGRGKRLEDIDIPTIGKKIGVGEDPLHAVMDVEARNSGFDSRNRVVMLFEPHIFYRELKSDPATLELAVKAGVAYPQWGQSAYPKDSYPRFQIARDINERCAYRSCSWGLGQVMGFNSSLAGYDTAYAMVSDFSNDEDNQLEGMVNFILNSGLDDELRDLESAKTDAKRLVAAARFARGYNGPGYARHGYHTRIVERYKFWLTKPDTKIKDTAWWGRFNPFN